MVTRFHALQDLAVLDATGAVVGRVVDLELDPDDWQVKALVVRVDRAVAGRLGVRRFLGPSELSLKIIHVHAVGDAILLRDSMDDLARLAQGADGEAASHP